MKVEVERLDHLPVIAGTIKEIGLIEKIDALIPPHEDEIVSTGQAIAALIICGMGFLQKPLSLTPHFFESRPIGYLLGNEKLKAKDFNRFKLSRELENLYLQGPEQIFSQLSAEICQEQGIAQNVVHGDTTSFSFDGQYDLEEDQDPVVKITHGYSKDHRPDLKQIVLEMAVSPDGGVPVLMAPWSGNASDSKIFHERLKKLSQNLDLSSKCIVLDSKGYSQRNQVWYEHLTFVSRVPATYAAHDEWIQTAIDLGHWTPLNEDEEKFWQEFEHEGERWIVVYTRAGFERSTKNLEKGTIKEAESFQKKVKAFQRKSFACEEDARKAALELLKKLKYHKLKEIELDAQSKHTGPGRPKANAQKQVDSWRVSKLELELDENKIQFLDTQGACYIVATNAKEMPAEEVVRTYSEQSQVERGFRFLKDPQFFTSSMFLKKPERIQGLLVVMTLALLVYALAERKLRHSLKENQETLPNQIKQQTSTPTLRWVFQLLDGINRVHIEISGQPKQSLIEGLNENKEKAIKQFWPAVLQYYHIVNEVPCSM